MRAFTGVGEGTGVGVVAGAGVGVGLGVGSAGVLFPQFAASKARAKTPDSRRSEDRDMRDLRNHDDTRSRASKRY
jgi:hypothetical protein